MREGCIPLLGHAPLEMSAWPNKPSLQCNFFVLVFTDRDSKKKCSKTNFAVENETTTKLFWRGFSTLVMVGTCHWEFESRPIQIPVFEEKVTHSIHIPSRSDFGLNFDQNYLIVLKFS